MNASLPLSQPRNRASSSSPSVSLPAAAFSTACRGDLAPGIATGSEVWEMTKRRAVVAISSPSGTDALSFSTRAILSSKVARSSPPGL